MKPWNQAAWKQNTYRTSSRKMHGPVGPANPLAVVHVACKGCGYHFCSCSHAPDGWRVAETGVDDAPDYRERATPVPNCCYGGGCSDRCYYEVTHAPCDGALTVADVAKLPVGTTVVVASGSWLPVGEPMRINMMWSDGTFHLIDSRDTGYSVSPTCDATFRLIDAKPALLTLPEAAEACRAGKTVRCVEDSTGWHSVQGWLFRNDSLGLLETDRGRNSWRVASQGLSDFPELGMRFEVVE